MVATKTPPTSDPKAQTETPVAEETPPTPAPAEDGLASSIKAFIHEEIADALAAIKPTRTGARPTFRDEEEGMAERVAEGVRELLTKEKAANENHPTPGVESAPPEPVPAAPQPRRIEKALWS